MKILSKLSIEWKFVNCAAAISFENPSNLWYYAEWFFMNRKISEQILEANLNVSKTAFFYEIDPMAY